MEATSSHLKTAVPSIKDSVMALKSQPGLFYLATITSCPALAISC